MAKLIVTTQMVDSMTVYAFSDNLTLRRHTSDFARLLDDSGYTVVVRGDNLVYDGIDIVGGIIRSLALLDPEGTLCTSVTGASLKGSTLLSTTNPNWGLDSFFNALSGNDRCIGSAQPDLLMGGDGRDVMTGKGGADHFWAGTGNDRMTGGGGSDVFEIQGGHDIITDFESEGADALHDHIDTFSNWTKHRDGNDTVIEFSDGSSVRLLDFKPADLDNSDVRFPF